MAQIAELTFEKDGHVYRFDGTRIPSVTQIIGEYLKVGNIYVNVFTGSIIDAEIFEAAGKFGTIIHDMISEYIQGGLCTESYPPEALFVLFQYQRWEGEMNPSYIDTENMLYSCKYKFAGTYDIKCFIGGKLYIIDIKTGAFNMAGPQLAAYVQLDKEDDKSRKLRHRAVLYLPKDGNIYKWYEYHNQSDWPFFLSRLTTYNYIGR